MKKGRFVDIAASHNFFPTISMPTRITDTASTLIDNIYISPDEVSYASGNLLTGLSDHLAQFLIPVSKEIHEPHRYSMYRNWRDWKKESFVEEFRRTDWEDLLSNNNADYSQGYYKAHWIDRRNFFQNDLCPTNKRPSQNNSNLL